MCWILCSRRCRRNWLVCSMPRCRQSLKSRVMATGQRSASVLPAGFRRTGRQTGREFRCSVTASHSNCPSQHSKRRASVHDTDQLRRWALFLLRDQTQHPQMLFRQACEYPHDHSERRAAGQPFSRLSASFLHWHTDGAGHSHDWDVLSADETWVVHLTVADYVVLASHSDGFLLSDRRQCRDSLLLRNRDHSRGSRSVRC